MWTVREVNKGDFEAINQLNTEQLMGSGVLNPSYQVLYFTKGTPCDLSQARMLNIFYTPTIFSQQVDNHETLFCLIETENKRVLGYLNVHLCQQEGNHVYVYGMVVSNLYFYVERFYVSRRYNRPEIGRKLFEYFEMWRAEILRAQKH
ncbi:hypothetical protein [Vibrio owensii]|uniref:hypothetical protein n=1 Tax=Vibrio owensii TaxID=696485 RepID=UPI001FD594B7|nr:hypothetical protein [Vibrio owensii]